MRPSVALLPVFAGALALSACISVSAPAPPREVVREERVVAAAPLDTAVVRAEVTSALMAQQARWNAGDLRGFMDVYLRVQETTFLSGGAVQQGWRNAFGAYMRAYPDRASMGTLTYSDLHVRPLSPETALVWGRWRLDRAADTPAGLFTLLMEKRMDGAWRILHDHTSSE